MPTLKKKKSSPEPKKITNITVNNISLNLYLDENKWEREDYFKEALDKIFRYIPPKNPCKNWSPYRGKSSKVRKISVKGKVLGPLKEVK